MESSMPIMDRSSTTNVNANEEIGHMTPSALTWGERAPSVSAIDALPRSDSAPGTFDVGEIVLWNR